MARNKNRARIMHELRVENAKLRSENKELLEKRASATLLKNASVSVQDHEIVEYKLSTVYDCYNAKPKEQVMSEMCRGICAHVTRHCDELILPNLLTTERYLGDGMWEIRVTLKILKPKK